MQSSQIHYQARCRSRYLSRHLSHYLLVAALASGVIPASYADSPNAASLADGCTSCHGLNGRSAGRIPTLAGADRARLVAQLQGFRAQKTAAAGDATIMNRIARGYSDAEIEALADFFSAVKP